MTTTTETTATGSALVRALEAVWDQIREQHPELPDVVIITGSGLLGGIPRWGHFWADRWRHAEPEDEGGQLIISEDDPTATAEMFIAGERLAGGPVATVQTMLHEASHALAQARGIKDTSRQNRWHNRRFLELARELGLDFPGDVPDKSNGYSAVEITEATRARYAGVIDELGAAIVAHLALPRFVLVGGGDGETGRRVRQPGEGRTVPRLACQCDEPRIIRASRKVVDAGPITCGLCGEPFEERSS